MRQFN